MGTYPGGHVIMGIDTSIYQNLGRGVKSVTDYDNEYTQQRQNKLAEMVSGMKMDEYSRGVDKTNRLNALYQSSMGSNGLDRNKFTSGAAAGGFGSELPGIQEGWAKADKATGEVDAQKFKLASDRHAIYQKEMGVLAQDPNVTKGKALQTVQNLVRQGILPAELYGDVTENLPDDPAQVRDLLLQGLKAQLTPEQIFTVFAPKAEKLDNGGSISFRDTNPNSPTYGQATGGATVPKVQSPDSIASNAIQIRGQNMTDARGREMNQITREVGLQKKELEVGKMQDEATARKQQRQAAASSVQNQIAVIDKALMHKGRETGTGLSGSIDPRNYIPGTDATDFKVVVDQIGGAAFLQAFESLKGGGQITEVEGKKATDAMARLNRAQSDKEFKTALTDLRKVMSDGLARMSQGGQASPSVNPLDSLLDKYK